MTSSALRKKKCVAKPLNYPLPPVGVIAAHQRAHSPVADVDDIDCATRPGVRAIRHRTAVGCHADARRIGVISQARQHFHPRAVSVKSDKLRPRRRSLEHTAAVAAPEHDQVLAIGCEPTLFVVKAIRAIPLLEQRVEIRAVPRRQC